MTDCIDSLEHPLAVKIKTLLNSREESAQQPMIIDDEDNIIQAQQANIIIEQLISTDTSALPTEITQALHPKTEIIELSKRTGKKLFGKDKASRLFAIAKKPAELSLHDLLKTTGDILVLDNVSISGNVGAIIRSALALQAGAVVLVGEQAINPYDRRVIRSSRGYVFRLPVIKTHYEELIAFCKKEQLPIISTSSHAKQSLDQLQLNRRGAFILGSEKYGCHSLLEHAASSQLKIPLNPKVESLNVSVAAAIILYARAVSKNN